MNQVLVELTVDSTFPWSESVLSRLRQKVQDRAFNELDRRMGGDSWCSEVQPITVEEGRLILFHLSVPAANVDIPLVFSTFQKHWRDVQSEEKSKYGVSTKKNSAIAPPKAKRVAARDDEEDEAAAAPRTSGNKGALAVIVCGLVLLLGGLGIGIWLLARGSSGEEPLAGGDGHDEENLPIVAPVAKQGAWWDAKPELSLNKLVAELKTTFPDEGAGFDNLGSRNDALRGDAYKLFIDKAPAFVRTIAIRDMLALVCKECYLHDPADPAVTPVRSWIVSQFHVDGYPPRFKAEDYDCSLWAMQLAMNILAGKTVSKGRAELMAGDLQKTFQTPFDLALAPEELTQRTGKLVAQRFYTNLIKLATKDPEHALVLREALAQKAGNNLAKDFRDRADLEIALAGITAPNAPKHKYEPLIQGCLKGLDQASKLKVVNVYELAPPDVATYLEPILVSGLQLVKIDGATRGERATSMRTSILKPDPTQVGAGGVDRAQQFKERYQQALANLQAPLNKPIDVLQETVVLTHASTLACAFVQKGAGLARFDELVEDLPQLAGADPMAGPMGSGPGMKGNQNAGGGLMLGKGPLSIQGILQLTDPRDQVRRHPAKQHMVRLRPGRLYTIDMIGNFDPYLRLESPQGMQVAADDDSGGGLNARITYVCQMDGNFRVVATSCSGGVGPYTLIVSEGFGGGGAFGGGGFPIGPGGGVLPPVGPAGAGFGGGMGFGGGLPGMMQPQPKTKKGRFNPLNNPLVPNAGLPGMPMGADMAKPAPVNPQALKSLGATAGAQLRLNAFRTIVSNLQGDLFPQDAERLANYLLASKPKAETDEVITLLPPLRQATNFKLALADAVATPDKGEAAQKVIESVLTAFLEKEVAFPGDDQWRLRCRKMILEDVLEGEQAEAGKESDDAGQVLTDLYRTQGSLLGMDNAELSNANRASKALEAVTRHVAFKVLKDVQDKDGRAILDTVTHELQVAQFLSRNDLEHTVLLQRAWLKVLGLYVARQEAKKAPETQRLLQEFFQTDRQANHLLQQLRAGEERALRLWGLLHEKG